MNTEVWKSIAVDLLKMARQAIRAAHGPGTVTSVEMEIDKFLEENAPEEEDIYG